jgi:hypothetical protein
MTMKTHTKNGVERKGQKIRLSLIHPIYKKVTLIKRTREGIVTKEQTNKLVKEIRVIKWINWDAIISVEEYVTSTGTIAKNRCIIYDKYTNRHYATWHPIDHVLDVIEGLRKDHAVGFKSNQYARII